MLSLCTVGSDYFFGTSMFTGHAECSSFTPIWSKPDQFGCSEEQEALKVLSEENCAYGKINACAGGQVPLCSASWLHEVELSCYLPWSSESRFLGLGEAEACSGAVRCGVMDVWVSSPGERKTKGGTRHYAKSLAPQEEIVCLVTCTWKLDSWSYHNLQL